MVKVLQMLADLVKFGYYDDSAYVKPLLPSIHKMLNGKEDFPTREIKAATETTIKDEIQKRKFLMNTWVLILASSKFKVNDTSFVRLLFSIHELTCPNIAKLYNMPHGKEIVKSPLLYVIEFVNMKRTFGRLSFRRSQRTSRRAKKRDLTEEEDDFVELPPYQDDTNDNETDKILAEFRGEGKRYQFDEERQNHFKIKHW